MGSGQQEVFLHRFLNLKMEQERFLPKSFLNPASAGVVAVEPRTSTMAVTPTIKIRFTRSTPEKRRIIGRSEFAP